MGRMRIGNHFDQHLSPRCSNLQLHLKINRNDHSKMIDSGLFTFKSFKSSSYWQTGVQKCHLCIDVVVQTLRKVGGADFVFGCELAREAQRFVLWRRACEQQGHLGLHRHVAHSGSHLERSFQRDHVLVTIFRCETFKHFHCLLFNFLWTQLANAVHLAETCSQANQHQHHDGTQGEHRFSKDFSNGLAIVRQTLRADKRLR